MMNSEEIILEALSPKRYTILLHLKDEKHPEDIAKELNITRQAVDKHLSLLYRCGLLEKRMKESNRMKVYYQISEAGIKLLDSIDDAISNYILEIEENMENKLRELDEALVYGNLSEMEYKYLRRKEEERFSWTTHR